MKWNFSPISLTSGTGHFSSIFPNEQPTEVPFAWPSYLLIHLLRKKLYCQRFIFIFISLITVSVIVFGFNLWLSIQTWSEFYVNGFIVHRTNKIKSSLMKTGIDEHQHHLWPKKKIIKLCSAQFNPEHPELSVKKLIIILLKPNTQFARKKINFMSLTLSS